MNGERCPSCGFTASAAGADSAPPCGCYVQMPAPAPETHVLRGVLLPVVLLLSLLAFATLFSVRRYYQMKAAESFLAEQYGIVDTTVREEPQKPWFWSLFRSRPTVEEIFEQNAEACGGAEALRALASVRADGDIFFVDRSTQASSGYTQAGGKFVVRAKAPDKVFAELVLTRYGGGETTKQTVRRGFDGERGWEYVESQVREPGFSTPVRKAALREVVGAELDMLKHQGLGAGLGPLRGRYTSLALLGQEKVGKDVSSGVAAFARETYVVRGQSADGRTEVLYFDIADGLLRRIDFEDASGGVGLIECYLEDHRQVGKFKLPFRVVYKVNNTRITMNFGEYRLNAPADDTVFLAPRS